MINEPAKLTIRARFPRPTPAQIAAFKDVPTGFVCDAMEGQGALDSRIQPIGGGRDMECHAVGPALVADNGPAEILATMGALHAGHLSLPQLFRAMSLNPSRRLGLPQGRLAVGAPADLVLFDPDAPFVLDRFTLQSKSKNTPFDGQKMEGRVLATFVGGTQVFEAGS